MGRAALAPAAVVYGAGMRARARLYAAGWRARHRLPMPAVGIGSLQVGGAGKTPLAAWVADWFRARGARPAILLRGYGGDEGPMLRALVPGAKVVEDPDRLRGGARARRRGATVAVVVDSAQHLRVAPDRQLLLLSVEALAGTRALLPAGPWREPWDHGHADVLVVTRKSASRDAAEAARRALRRAYPGVPIAQAHFRIRGWRPLRGGAALPDAALAGKALVAVCGVADPRPFLERAGRVGRLVGSEIRRDHASYQLAGALRLARAAESAGVDYVVTTAKDAVKLHPVWPAGGPPVLVADLALSWDLGEDLVIGELEACLPDPPAPGLTHAARHAAAGTA